MGWGDSASALWRAFAWCERIYGTIYADSVSRVSTDDEGILRRRLQAWQGLEELLLVVVVAVVRSCWEFCAKSSPRLAAP